MAGGRVMAAGNIHCEVSERVEAIGFGGLGLMRLLLERLGAAEAIDAGLRILERHLPYRESDHVLNLVLNVAGGGRCLQDAESKRRDPAYLRALGADRLPAPSTSGDFLRRFRERLVEALERCWDGPRLRAWSHLDAKRRRLAVIDADGSLAETDGECKRGMGRSWDGKWGYQALVVSLSNTGEVLRTLNRSGNRPSHEGAVAKMDEAAALALRGGFERVLLRGDTDFALTTEFDRWDESGIWFVFGKDAAPGLIKRAESLDESAWSPMVREPKRKGKRKRGEPVKERIVSEKGYLNRRLEAEHVAEVDYRPVKCGRAYRLVILRKTITRTRGQGRLFPEIVHFFYIANLPKEGHSAADVVRHSNRRCAQEKVVEQLKNGVAALRMPSDGPAPNWAWMVIAAQAWNLKCRLALVLPERLGAGGLASMHYRRFLREVIQIPCQILRRGGRLIFRLPARNEWTRLLTEGCAWLRCGPAAG